MTWFPRARFIPTCFLLLILAAPPARAIDTQITYTDDPDTGFWDATHGAARRAAFQHAVDRWAAELSGGRPLEISAQFNLLGGDANGALLGRAAPGSFQVDFANAPFAGTWYPVGLANQYYDGDLDPGVFDIEIEFNEEVDNSIVLGEGSWYYGTDGNPPVGDIDLVAVALHELAHGLGFLDLISSTTGSWASGYPDIYGLQLTRPGVGDFGAISDSQRLSALTSDEVYWKGPSVVAQAGGQVKIYAPDPYQGGSSIAHWDTSNSPDLLMEPSYWGTGDGLDLTPAAMRDIGWSLTTPPVSKISTGNWTIY